MMTETSNLWRVEILATDESVNTFEEALNFFCETVCWFTTDIDGVWRVEGFSQNEPNRSRLTFAFDAVANELAIPVPKIQIAPVAPRDWVADSLRMFPPTKVGRFFVYGSYFHETIPFGLIPILLNPGRAFGSGEHPTTKGCLLAISDLARKQSFKNLIDMGCGSGILSIALAKALRTSVYAFDVDSNAVLVAKENIRHNGVAPLVHASHSDGYDSIKVKNTAPYDLIISNILANPLCKMAKNLNQISGDTSKNSCVVVLSGFLDCDTNRVYAAHYVHGFRLLRAYHIQGWCTLVLRR